MTSGLSCLGGIREALAVVVTTGTEDEEGTREDEEEGKATGGNGKSTLDLNNLVTE